MSISADQEYVVRSGIKTTFTLGVIQSLMIVEDFKRPISIVPTPGDESKVIFGNVHDGITGKKFYVEPENREKEPNISAIVYHLQRQLGVEVQSKDSIAAEKEEVQAREEANPRRTKVERSVDEFE
jgi:hypothetical protein